MRTLIRGTAQCDKEHTWSVKFSMQLVRVERTADDCGKPTWEFSVDPQWCPKCMDPWQEIGMIES